MARRADSLEIDQISGHGISNIKPTVVVAGVKSPIFDQRSWHVRSVSGLPPCEAGVCGFVIGGSQVSGRIRIDRVDWTATVAASSFTVVGVSVKQLPDLLATVQTSVAADSSRRLKLAARPLESGRSGCWL